LSDPSARRRHDQELSWRDREVASRRERTKQLWGRRGKRALAEARWWTAVAVERSAMLADQTWRHKPRAAGVLAAAAAVLWRPALDVAVACLIGAGFLLYADRIEGVKPEPARRRTDQGVKSPPQRRRRQ
jgi:hypothetical protein